MSTTTETEDHEFDLAPHEQLDEIDLRTNDDGSVEVRILEWEKHPTADRVSVKFRTPAGEVKTEKMPWPQSKDPEYKFIRLIQETPYTLRTAEQINDDDELWLDAEPESWKLDLPEPTTLSERLKGFVPEDGSMAKELTKMLFFPLVIIVYIFMLFDYDISYSMSSSVIDSRDQLTRVQTSVKTILYLLIWLGLMSLLLV